MVRDSRTVLTNLWTSNGINLPSSILKNVKLNLPAGETHKNEQSLKSSFRIGVAAQVSISATSLASCFLHELRKEIKSMHLERASMSENGKKKEVTRNEVEVENDLQDLIIGCSKRIPTITVSERHSSLEFASEKFTRVVKSDTFLNYNPDPSEMEAASIHFLDSKARSLIGISEDAVGDWDSVAGIYETKPKGELRQFVRLHTNFPHHKRGLLRILNLLKTPQESETKEKCSKPTEEEKVITREMIQEKLKEWNALDFETEVREKGFCATMMRTEKEWEDSQMGKEVRKLVEEWEGPVLVEKIEETQDVRATSDRGSGDDAIVTRSSQEISCRNLENGFGGQFDRSLRILDLSRVIAGPVAGRALAGEFILLRLRLAFVYPYTWELFIVQPHSSRSFSPASLCASQPTSSAFRNRYCKRETSRISRFRPRWNRGSTLWSRKIQGANSRWRCPSSSLSTFRTFLSRDLTGIHSKNSTRNDFRKSICLWSSRSLVSESGIRFFNSMCFWNESFGKSFF